MPNIDDEIRARTEAFANELTGLIRRAALEAAATALGGGAPAAPAHVPAKRGRPRKVAPAPVAAPPARSAAAAKSAKAPAAKAPVGRRSAAAAAAKRAPGAKRPPGELVKLTERLGEYIKSHPGLRMENIGKALGAPTRELNLPIKKLLAAKKIRSEGHKRATEYFPA
jgi:hypothetical protein